MADTIRVTAAPRINSSPGRGREQYRDIDHHIRNNVHPSIHYLWEPAGFGERKLTTTFRILGAPQFDVFIGGRRRRVFGAGTGRERRSGAGERGAVVIAGAAEGAAAFVGSAFGARISS
ncbi:MAG: hypothetical protein ABI548_19880 [Polyangiaceae bacterium]